MKKLLVLSLLAICSSVLLQAQSISCDSLLKMRFLQFDMTNIPDGFLDCLEFTEDDIPNLRAQEVKAQERPGTTTVGDVKHIIDSLNALGYRDNREKMRQCMALFKKGFNAEIWTADSQRLFNCGAAASELEVMGRIWRTNPEKWKGKNLAELAGEYERQLPAVKEAEVATRSSFCVTDPAEEEFVEVAGIRAFYNFDAAIDCSRKQGKPLLIYFTALDHAKSRRMESKEWAELDVFRMLNEEYVVLIQYRDDLTELPEAEHYPSSLEPDFTIKNKAHQAIELVYRYIESTDIPSLTVIGRRGQVIQHKIGMIQTVESVRFFESALKEYQEAEF